MTAEEIASVAHEINRAYCQSLNDFTRLPWEYAPQWQKDRAWKGVRLFLQYPNAGPEAWHEHWMAQKILNGWKYGPEKNVEAKEDPLLVPFSELPHYEQAKDYILHAVVHALK